MRHFGAGFAGVGNRIVQLVEVELSPLRRRRHARSGYDTDAKQAGGASDGMADTKESGLESFTGASRPGARRAVVANVHLTFPHDEHDRRLRYWQAQMALWTMERFSAAVVGAASEETGRRPAPLRPGDLEIITGDFNLPALQDDDASDELGKGSGSKRDPLPYRVKSDPVYRLLIERGFVSGYRQLHRREPLATHVTHTGDYSTADFVFYRVVGKDGAAVRIDGRPGRRILPVPTFDPSTSWSFSGDAPMPARISECPGVAEAVTRSASLWPAGLPATELLDRPTAGYFAQPAVALRLERLEDRAYAAETGEE